MNLWLLWCWRIGGDADGGVLDLSRWCVLHLMLDLVPRLVSLSLHDGRTLERAGSTPERWATNVVRRRRFGRCAEAGATARAAIHPVGGGHGALLRRVLHALHRAVRGQQKASPLLHLEVKGDAAT